MDVYTERERERQLEEKTHQQNKHERARGGEADDLLDQCV